MASELNSMFPDTYHPRRNDIVITTNSNEPRLPDNRTTNFHEYRLPHSTRPPTAPNFMPSGLPTPFVPLHNLPQPHPLHTVPFGTPFPRQPIVPNYNIQPVFSPQVPFVNPQPPLQRIHLQNSTSAIQPGIPQLSYAQAANPLHLQNALNAIQRPQNPPVSYQNHNNA